MSTDANMRDVITFIDDSVIAFFLSSDDPEHDSALEDSHRLLQGFHLSYEGVQNEMEFCSCAQGIPSRSSAVLAVVDGHSDQ